MICLTGDTHGELDIDKLKTANFPQQSAMTRNDYIVVLGDFGLLWERNHVYKRLLSWWRSRNFTVLWMDGNHENHKWLDDLQISLWHSGKVHKIAPNIIHLMRGQVFEIEGATFFTMGGAWSADQKYHIVNETWWAREELNKDEAAEAWKNLARYDNSVDFILTHAAPKSLSNFLTNTVDYSRTGIFLEEILQKVKFSRWCCGHYHSDCDLGQWGLRNFSCFYDRIERIL